MKNIADILKDIGIEIPEDKTTDFNKAVSENYKTVAEYEKKVTRLEGERDGWKEKAETAETTLKGFDGVDLAKMNQDIADWKAKAEQAERDYTSKLQQRDFEDALKNALEDVKFTSNSAKQSVISEIRSAGLSMHDGKIVGLSDVLENIRAKDASAFVDEEEEELEKNKAKFTDKLKPNAKKTYKSKQEIMDIKDPRERQTAIAENINPFKGE